MSAKLSTKVMPYGNYYVKKWYNVLNGIESDSETVILPSKNDDGDITHIGYYEKTTVLEPDWADYHHGKANNDVELYEKIPQRIKISPCIKTIVIPATVLSISEKAFEGYDDRVFIVDEQNPIYTASADGKILKKA